MADRGILRLRLLRDDATPPSPDGSAVAFGLQDNKEAIHAGARTEAGGYAFDFTVRVAAAADEEQPPVFLGPFVFGRPQDRFVYLSWQRSEDGSAGYVNRVKARLADIDWAMVRAAQESGGTLEADLSGRKAGGGKVPVAWRLIEPEPVPETEDEPD